MKLLFCPQCQDIVRLFRKTRRRCECGACSGQYLDELNAVYSGPAIPLGFSNPSFVDALHHQPQEGWGRNFEAFVIPKICPTFIRDDAGPQGVSARTKPVKLEPDAQDLFFVEAAFNKAMLAMDRRRTGLAHRSVVLFGTHEDLKHEWAERMSTHAARTHSPLLHLRTSRNCDIPARLDASLSNLFDLPQPDTTGDLDLARRQRLREACERLRGENRLLLLLIERLDLASKKSLTELCHMLHSVAQENLPIALVATAKPTIRGKLGRAHADAERLFLFFVRAD